jgi:hypothetical protein
LALVLHYLLSISRNKAAKRRKGEIENGMQTQ